jgi:hypothetical protein
MDLVDVPQDALQPVACVKCGQGEHAGKPTYCAGPLMPGAYGSLCDHRQKFEHLLLACSTCGYAIVAPCADAKQ